MSANWDEALSVLVNKIQDAVKGGKEIDFQILNDAVNDLRKQMRELIQHLTRKDLEGVIGKLKKNKKLEPQELQLVRLWVVGDAYYYVKHENNYQDWIREAGRIRGEIEQIKGQTPNAENSSFLKALLMDLERTTADIAFYLRHKARVDQFNASTQEIDADEAKLLVEMLEQKIHSKQF